MVLLAYFSSTCRLVGMSSYYHWLRRECSYKPYRVPLCLLIQHLNDYDSINFEHIYLLYYISAVLQKYRRTALRRPVTLLMSALSWRATFLKAYVIIFNNMFSFSRNVFLFTAWNICEPRALIGRRLLCSSLSATLSHVLASTMYTK